MAGKTGTADSEIGKEPTAWFVGFGPTADPQYVVVCVIDQAGYGATAAAPVVRSIFDYLATHPVTAPGIPPEQSIVQATHGVAPPRLGPDHHHYPHDRPGTGTGPSTTGHDGPARRLRPHPVGPGSRRP